MAKEITTATHRIWIGEDGIMRVQPFAGINVALAEAKETVAMISTLAEGKKLPLLIYMKGVTSVDRDARAYFSSAEGRKTSTAIALLVDSAIARMLANFVIGMGARSPTPFHLFNSEDEALQWLRTFQ